MVRCRCPTGGSCLPPKAQEGRWLQPQLPGRCSRSWGTAGTGSPGLERVRAAPLREALPALEEQLWAGSAVEVWAEGRGLHMDMPSSQGLLCRVSLEEAGNGPAVFYCR